MRRYGSTGRLGPPDGDPVGIVLVNGIPAWIEPARVRGQRLLSLLSPRRSAPWLLAGTKSTSYAANIAAEAEAKRNGFDDALFVDADGIVLEGPVTNVWWRVGRTLSTPGLELGILAGETRAALIELAVVLGYAVVEGAFTLRRRPPGGGGDVHVVVGSRGDAGGRSRRAPPPPRTGCRRASERVAPRRRRCSGTLAARCSVDDQVGHRDRVVPLHIAVLHRHPDVLPRRAGASPSRATPRARRTSRGASTQTRRW